MSKPVSSCFLRPYYEQDTFCHWEVLLNPEQIRPGQLACDEISMFVEEHQAREFVRDLKTENPDLVELAVVPSACHQSTAQEA